MELATTGTRARLIAYLFAHPQATSLQIAQELGLKAAGIRRHLGCLVDDGTVDVVDVSAGQYADDALPEANDVQSRRGRPAKRYVLSRKAREHYAGSQYETLAGQALHALHEVGGNAAVIAFARKRVANMTAALSPLPRNSDEHAITEQADQIAEAFRRQGHRVSVQCSCGQVRFIHQHCPIESVARAFPALCQAEHETIARLFPGSVQTTLIACGQQPICAMQVRLPDPTIPSRDGP